MGKIGIIVNPFSGKDLRRITTQASNVSNNEKVKKVVRMIHSMKIFKVEKVYLMPDNFKVNANIVSLIQNENDLNINVEILDFCPTDNPQDTIKAAEMMKSLGVDCIIVLGGDGTSRLVAKTDLSVPIIPVSTGTNNVYPEFWEGTTVGIAASYISKYGSNDNLAHKGKRIEVSIDGKFVDIALVDAAITNVPYVGSRIVANLTDIEEVFVCRCSPELIGFSSLIGCIKICEDSDDFGYRMKITENGSKTLTSMSSGQLIRISYSDLAKMDVGTEYDYCPDFNGTIALDGERTVPFRKGSIIKFVITRNGPMKLDVKKTLCEAVENNFFKLY